VPIVSLELGSNLNGSSIREGIDVYFECNIKSNPWVYKVSWRHNVSVHKCYGCRNVVGMFSFYVTRVFEEIVCVLYAAE
jgi:hypothetical protein